MSPLYNSVSRAALVFGLSALVVLSGCIGGGGSKNVPSSSVTQGPLPAPTSSEPVDCAADGDASDCAGVGDALRHQHHYWGERTEVDIFYKTDLELQQSPFKGNSEGCRTIGHKEFTLESDENDAGGAGDPPVNEEAQPNPRADVVFAGTVRIDVELLNLNLPTAPSGAPTGDVAQAFLLWKPANLQFYQPNDGCGMPLKVGEVKSITVGPGAADPPHQWLVSRWSFKVWVATPQGEEGAVVPHVAQGTFGIRMTAVNGMGASLDPAHPDLWEGKETYDLGCTTAEGVPRQVVVTGNSQTEGAFDRPPQEPLTNIMWEYGRIVPLMTQRVTGTLEYNYKGPFKGTPLQPTLKLLYYGADTNSYASPDKVEPQDGKWAFTIEDPEQRKADPPYRAETLWRFQLLPLSPVAQPDGTNIADFEGDYTLCFTAHKIPGAIIT